MDDDYKICKYDCRTKGGDSEIEKCSKQCGIALRNTILSLY